MPGRRVIATAEVQVASDVKQAEAGLNGLTEAFRSIGQVAERAAEKAEAAFFGTARSVKGGYGQMVAASEDLIASMAKGDRIAKNMAETFREALAAVTALSNKDMDTKAIEALRVFKEISGAAGAIDAGLHDATATAKRLALEAQQVEDAIKQAELRAEQLGEAFRDVGRDIDLAMAGGLEGVQDDIRDTIRRLEDLGGEFRDVGRIGEAALNGILSEVDNEADQATAALMRLERQLHEVAQIGDRALEGLDDDARQAAAALNTMSSSARRADRAIDGIGSVSRRTAGDVRGLVGLLGAAGLGFAAASAARAGIEMTLQLEKSEAMFLGLTGSVEGAANMLERMVVFARETPYNLANVSDAAAQLLAVGDGFGVTTSNIEDYLTAFGNAITMTGGGDEQFTRLVRVFGQMSSSGKVLGQDMNQLAQSLPGYNVWEALAEGANTSVAELRRLQDLGTLDNLLTGDEAVRILVEGMEKIPGAAGAMERRMNTLGGAIEKFRETAQFAMSKGLIPFSETAQDVLSDPVILNSVEDLSFAFGDLLSSALEDVRPELDDLAAGAEDLLVAFQDWTPVLTTVVDVLGDFLGFIAPIVSGVGKAADAVLNFGDGLGKLGVAAGLFAAGGPIGIAGGVLLGVSGALDMFSSDNEEAADMARMLAAAQGEVNDAMAVGEEAIYTEAQQLAIDTATKLRDEYGELANAMASFDVTVADLQTGMSALATGTGSVSPELQRMLDYFNNPDMSGGKVIGQFEELAAAYERETDVISEETAKQQEVLAIAGVEDLAALDERKRRQDEQLEATKAYWEAYGETYAAAMEEQAVANDGWGQLDEERTDALRSILEDQASAYQEWEDDINGSTESAALSLSEVAADAENSARRMIDAINENSIATANWKSNIVDAAVGIQGALGLSDEEAQTFMSTLGSMGSESAPALQAMLDNFNSGGTELQEFFSATKLNADVMAQDLTTAFDDATGSVPTLAESLADGTLTVEGILAALPEAMQKAGKDLETTAANIDVSDEMGAVGTEAVNGLIATLSSPSAIARARAAGAALGRASADGTRAALEVESPSRVMMDIGEFAVEGLVVGMQNMSDEAYDVAVQTASLISGGIAWHFRDAEKPQEEARKFAEEVAQSIVDELIAEQEAVADAAEALADAAADRLSEAWDRVKDRFKTRDIKEAIAEAQAELKEARAELKTAESLAGAGGSKAMSEAKRRVAAAQAALTAAEAADVRADRLAEQTLTTFQRGTEDLTAALQDQQTAEVDAIEARIAAANRNLDPVARRAAEADLAATKERHEAEMTALDRRREDEETALRLRLSKEDAARESAIKAQETQLKAFEKGLSDVVKSVQDAIKNLPGLREGVTDAQRDLEGAFFDQFEELLKNVTTVDRGLLTSIGAKAGLNSREVNDLIAAAMASSSANAGASAAKLGVEQLLSTLSTGLFTLGADGALGIAAGLSSQQQAIADAMLASLQYAISATLYNMQIKSPSRVTSRMIGEPMAEGIAAGIMRAQSSVSSAMNGLVDNVVGNVRIPSASQLVGDVSAVGVGAGGYGGPLVTMPGAIIQDATDADLVAQRVVVALAATGVDA